VLSILGDAGPRPGKITDTRVHDITVRHLLQHSGGFNRARSGDVVFLPGAADAAKRQGGPLPPDCPTILRDTLERKLDFTPGERFAYSNIGYCILGRVVERVAGMPYEVYARERVLAPAGAARMKVGRTLEAAEGEVTYYDYRGAKGAKATPGFGLRLAPRPYGTFAMETMDSYGGWIGAPVDYLRFILAIDGRRGAALLNGATVAEMNARSRLQATGDDDEGNAEGESYGLGIRRPPAQERAEPVAQRLAARHPDDRGAHRRRLRLGRRLQRPTAGPHRVQARARPRPVDRQEQGEEVAGRRPVRAQPVEEA
jgi:N-acyl-D-amino-acid deacylase